MLLNFFCHKSVAINQPVYGLAIENDQGSKNRKEICPQLELRVHLKKLCWYSYMYVLSISSEVC